VNHDLLSDPDCATAQRWGAFGPKLVNGEATTGPLRSTFVVDVEGMLQSVEYELDAASHVANLRQQIGA
jgi:peroxiredoxin Q/BCP